MRVLIIGGVAGGMSAATRLRRLDETAEIVVFERGRSLFHRAGSLLACLDRSPARTGNDDTDGTAIGRIGVTPMPPATNTSGAVDPASLASPRSPAK